MKDEIKGLSAFQVFHGMKLHFNPKTEYDGWKYSFKTNSGSAPVFVKSSVQVKCAYADLVKHYPSIVDQVKLFYPAFSKMSARLNVLDIKIIKNENAKFVELMSNFEKDSEALIQKIKRTVVDYDRLIQINNLFPNVYELFNDGIIDQHESTILFMLIPSLNNTSSKEPFVYDKWKKQLLFDRKFYSLYILPDLLVALQRYAKDELKVQ